MVDLPKAGDKLHLSIGIKKIITSSLVEKPSMSSKLESMKTIL
jgi:hypothetical protein